MAGSLFMSISWKSGLLVRCHAHKTMHLLGVDGVYPVMKVKKPMLLIAA